MAEEKTEYAASREYLKGLDLRAPRNIPAKLMSEIQGSLIATARGTGKMRAAQMAGHNAKIANWSTYSRDQRFQFAQQMTDVEEIKAAMMVQVELPGDNDLLEYLAIRKKELEEELVPQVDKKSA